MPEVVGGAVAIAAFVLFRHYAARQIAARRGVFVWAFAFPMVLGAAVVVWAGLRLLSSGQIVGGFLILFGVILGSVAFPFFRRASRAVSTAAPGDDVAEALLEPTADFMLTTTVASLLFALLGGVALVAWAIVNQNH